MELKNQIRLWSHNATETRVFAPKATFRIVVPWGNWFGASPNFYSLLGTDDKKIAQTENPQSSLSCYTCSHPFIFLFFSLLSLRSILRFSFPLFLSFSLFLVLLSILQLSAPFHLRSRDARFVSLLPSHRRISRKSSRVGLGLLARTAWKDSPDPIAVSVHHSPLARYLFCQHLPFSFSWNHFDSIPQLLLPVGSPDCCGIACDRLSPFGRSIPYVGTTN